MKIQYKNFNFRNATLGIIEKANDIIAEYMAEGYELTLRQLYYQFVARGLIENKEIEYKRIGGVLNDGRLAGEIDWNAIVDRTRKIQINGHWDSPSDIIQESADCYAIDTRETQEVYVEVWIEKEALALAFRKGNINYNPYGVLPLVLNTIHRDICQQTYRPGVTFPCNIVTLLLSKNFFLVNSTGVS